MTNTISKIIHNGDEFEFDTSSVSGITTTQPSNPSEGAMYYDTTNDVVKVYDGTNWNVVGDDAADINTKTFYLSSTSDLTTAQAAYDWFLAGKNPIIVLSGESYFISKIATSNIILTTIGNTTSATNSITHIYNGRVTFYKSGDTITSISGPTDLIVTSVLSTSNNYSTPYTPLYNGSPATKKYVDDTVASAKSSGATAPSNPTEGQLWYDTTNDVLKVYDGTNWVEVGKEYNAGEGIGIGTYDDYSAMRGPCPEGFHVPTISELQAIVSLLSSSFGISYSGNNLGQYLLMPLNGYRDDMIGSTVQQNNTGWLWSANSDEPTAAPAIYFTAGSGGVNSYYSKAAGKAVRPFKDEAVVPDSSWTTLYDGSSVATGAGIFHNSTLGLISVSGDGINWITIADKNLGATTVYNSGDTLSEANCGKYYQRGNNYGFPRTGSITTSSTQVDASNYGPGNYYYSDTFIKGNEDWSSVTNNNLRGGTTGVVTLNNAITNTGVLSVNGQTGDVTVPAATVISGDSGVTYTIKVSNSAPASGTPNTTITFRTN